jgi:hypothetical protein
MFATLQSRRAGAPVVLTGSSPSQQIRFNHGVYAWYAPGADVNGVSGFRVDIDVPQRQQFLGFLDTLLGEPSITGVQVAVYWRTLEGDTAGDYSPGFAAIDAILARCQLYGKKLIVNIFTAYFGNIASIYHVYPAYLVDGGSYGITPFHAPQVGGAARIWQAATMDRLIAMLAAYGARYNSNAYFEMIGAGETSLAIDDGTNGFSNANLLTQLQRLIPAARASWPNTAIRMAANDMGADSNLIALFATCATYQWSVGGPDVWPGDITQADRIFQGKNATGTIVSPDYRDVIPWCAEVQWQSFSGVWTLAQLWDAPVLGYDPTNGDFHMDTMKPRYYVWYVNEVNGNASTQWATGILPFLRTKGGTTGFTTKPTSYP